MPRRQLFPGHLVTLDKRPAYRHVLGGQHSLAGGFCANCEQPLTQFLLLDMSDPRIRIRGYGGSRLPLLYCMRCALAWEPFVYRLVDDDTIDILEARRGERCWEDWDYEVGSVSLPERQFDLLPVPEPVQELYDVLNGGGEISAQDEAVICTFTGHYADPEVGSYPIVDAINQVGGRSFLIQQLDDPECHRCAILDKEQTMFFLAGLTNDLKHGLRLTYEGVQIVFFFCPACWSVHVVHSV